MELGFMVECWKMLDGSLFLKEIIGWILMRK